MMCHVRSTASVGAEGHQSRGLLRATPCWGGASRGPPDHGVFFPLVETSRGLGPTELPVEPAAAGISCLGMACARTVTTQCGGWLRSRVPRGAQEGRFEPSAHGEQRVPGRARGGPTTGASGRKCGQTPRADGRRLMSLYRSMRLLRGQFQWARSKGTDLVRPCELARGAVPAAQGGKDRSPRCQGGSMADGLSVRTWTESRGQTGLRKQVTGQHWRRSEYGRKCLAGQGLGGDLNPKSVAGKRASQPQPTCWIFLCISTSSQLWSVVQQVRGGAEEKRTQRGGVQTCVHACNVMQGSLF